MEMKITYKCKLCRCFFQLVKVQLCAAAAVCNIPQLWRRNCAPGLKGLYCYIWLDHQRLKRETWGWEYSTYLFHLKEMLQSSCKSCFAGVVVPQTVKLMFIVYKYYIDSSNKYSNDRHSNRSWADTYIVVFGVLYTWTIRLQAGID